MKKYILIIVGLMIIPNMVYARERVTLKKCVDGDTARFIINGKEKTARFLAIDTPESVHPKKKVEPYGKEASKYTCDKLKNAGVIEIEYDKNSTKTDKYDRALVWVFVDNSLLQKDLVSKGYAKVAYLYDDYEYTNILKKEELKAKSKNLRIWSNKKTKVEDEIDYDRILTKIVKKLLKTIENMI